MYNANSYYIYLLGTAAEFSYFIDDFMFFFPKRHLNQLLSLKDR